MSTLRAGFARANINPSMGADISGYYKERKMEGILYDLEVNALAMEMDGKKVVLLCLDHCGIKQDLVADFHAAIAETCGIDQGSIYMAETHTHTGPSSRKSSEDPQEQEYIRFAIRRVSDAAKMALDDLKPAKMGWGIGNAPGVAFVRRFRMKDGSVRTNPGVDNPDILAPIGIVDERVSVLRFDREGGETLILANFANHPDVVGGCMISGDWPALLRRKVERSLEGTKCIFFNGAQGDVNHVNVHPRGGDLNGMFIDFDDVSRGYAHAKHIANVVAGGVLQVYEKVKYVDVDDIKLVQKTIQVPSNRPDPADLPEAHRIHDLHNAGKDAELPYEGMMLTTVVARAARMVRLEHGPDHFDMTLTGLKLGPVAMIGIPGEPFNGIGRALKETEGYEIVIPTCCTNGYEGYFPMQDAYDEGGYEAGSSSFKAGVAELIIKEGQTLLREM
ncbi:MAG: hypothetical protein IKC69_00300 [Clostridia bacterium]|nr:hypothetical protein [Clostridia bacterium]